MTIHHPLKEGTKILANVKTCACTGGVPTEVRGTILKVINNQSGTWYYLDSRHTIKSEAVKQVL